MAKSPIQQYFFLRHQCKRFNWKEVLQYWSRVYYYWLTWIPHPSSRRPVQWPLFFTSRSQYFDTQIPHWTIKTHFDSSFIKCLPLENRFIGGLNDECVSQLCHIDDIQYLIWHQWICNLANIKVLRKLAKSIERKWALVVNVCHSKVYIRAFKVSETITSTIPFRTRGTR